MSEWILAFTVLAPLLTITRLSGAVLGGLGLRLTLGCCSG
jgi:hypothetical protein